MEFFTHCENIGSVAKVISFCSITHLYNVLFQDSLFNTAYLRTPTNQECLHKSNITMDEFIRQVLKVGLISERKTNLARFFECSFKKKGYQYLNGELNFQKFGKRLAKTFKTYYTVKKSKTFSKNCVDNCKYSEMGITHGLTVIKFLNCVLKEIPKIYRKNSPIKNQDNFRMMTRRANRRRLDLDKNPRIERIPFQ